MSESASEGRAVGGAFAHLTADISDDRFEGLPTEAVMVHRRDDREALLSGRPVDSLTGLAPGQRLGPFRTSTGIDAWFHVFMAASRMQIRVAGDVRPVLVLTQARPPVVDGANTVIDIEAGTVWIRGDLVDAGLPADAFVGVVVAAGSLRLSGTATVTGDVVEVPGPLTGVLGLEAAPEDVTPVAGACASARATVELPDSLTFTFGPGPAAVDGTGGRAG